MVESGDASRPVRRVASLAELSTAERDALERLPMLVRTVPARQDILRLGDRPSQCCLVLAGFAFRYKLSSEGRRQIINFHVPGEIPDLQSLHLPVLDHNLAALTTLTAGFVQHEVLHEVSARFPRITGALWRETLADAALLRERVMSIGQRDGLSRTAHFLCEMFRRLEAVGLVSGWVMTLPITQIEIADALGLSPVHMNRMVRELRDRRLVMLDGQRVELLDWDALACLADFDPVYLHLNPDDRARRP